MHSLSAIFIAGKNFHGFFTPQVPHTILWQYTEQNQPFHKQQRSGGEAEASLPAGSRLGTLSLDLLLYFVRKHWFPNDFGTQSHNLNHAPAKEQVYYEIIARGARGWLCGGYRKSQANRGDSRTAQKPLVIELRCLATLFAQSNFSPGILSNRKNGKVSKTKCHH